MIAATPDPDDDGRNGDREGFILWSALEDTLDHYRRFMEGNASAIELHDPAFGTAGALAAAERWLLVDSSGAKRSVSESLEKQRQLLSRIVEELTAQRAEAQQGESEARSDHRRALRITGLIAVLALLTPWVQSVFKLLGVDL